MVNLELIVAIFLCTSGVLFLFSKDVVVSTVALIFTSLAFMFASYASFWIAPIIFMPATTIIISLLAILVQNKVSGLVKESFVIKKRTTIVAFVAVFFLINVLLWLLLYRTLLSSKIDFSSSFFVNDSKMVLNSIFIKHRIIYFTIFLLFFIIVFIVSSIKRQKDDIT